MNPIQLPHPHPITPNNAQINQHTHKHTHPSPTPFPPNSLEKLPHPPKLSPLKTHLNLEKGAAPERYLVAIISVGENETQRAIVFSLSINVLIDFTPRPLLFFSLSPLFFPSPPELSIAAAAPLFTGLPRRVIARPILEIARGA